MVVHDLLGFLGLAASVWEPAAMDSVAILDDDWIAVVGLYFDHQRLAALALDVWPGTYKPNSSCATHSGRWQISTVIAFWMSDGWHQADELQVAKVRQSISSRLIQRTKPRSNGRQPTSWSL